ncbi:MAG: asparagine synthase-related protein, partial [Myxococcota bacterium]
VAAAASERWPSPVRALTVRWQGADEAQAAADTAHALKAVHAVLPSGPRVSMVPDDGELPVDAFALVWRSLAEAMKPHGTTVWTGLGTDFIFAGRSSYGRILKRCGGGWLRSPSLWRGTRPSAAELRTALIRDMGRSEHRAWYAQDFLRGLRGYNGVQGCLSQVEAFDGEPLSALQHFDLTVTVPCGLMPMLEQVERVTGLRWRHPFFDTDTVSLMAAMPAHHRFDAGRRVILDRAAGLILPPNLIERPSRGLSPPVNHWLAHDLQAVVQTRLFGSRGSGLFDAKALRRAWYGLMLGRSQWAPSLIRVAALEGWAQRVLS